MARRDSTIEDVRPERLEGRKVAVVTQTAHEAYLKAFFTEVERQMRDGVLFIPVAAPVRWSLVGRGLEGFAENRFARHPLSALRERAGARN